MEEYSAKTEGPILRPRSSLFKPTVLAIALASMNFVWTMVLLLVTVIILFRKPMEPFREWHDTDIGIDLLFLLSCLYLYIESKLKKRMADETIKEAARPFIARTPVKFTTGLYWNETTGDTTFRVWNKNEPLYVGPRTSELDAAVCCYLESVLTPSVIIKPQRRFYDAEINILNPFFLYIHDIGSLANHSSIKI